MKLMRSGNYWSRANFQALYDRKHARSRTWNGTTKAVRLEHDLRLYPDGAGGLKIKMYNTEIIHYQADGYISLHTGGWNTPTTFARIRECTGVWLSDTSGVKYVTDAKTRVGTVESREGKASGWLRQSIPFIEGLRYRESDGEIHPDDIEKIPSEHRRTHYKPTKETDVAFKKLFAKISKRVRFSLNLGAWADRAIKDSDASLAAHGYSNVNHVMMGASRVDEVRAQVFLQDLQIPDYEMSDDRLYEVYQACAPANRIYSHDVEVVNNHFKKGFATFRKKLKDVFVDKFGATEKCGGEVLGNGYWVNPKEAQ